MIFTGIILSVLFGLGSLLFVVLIFPWVAFLLDKFKIMNWLTKYYDWCEKKIKKDKEDE